MVSCIRSNPGAGALRFHVIDSGISAESREKLRQSLGAGRAELFFYPLRGLAERMAGIDTGSYDISMLGRFFIGELLPETLETVLYLDCDTIVCGQLSPLFERKKLPLLCAVPEPTIYPSVLKQLHFGRKDDLYINSGVLLVNLRLWRETEAGARLLRFYLANGSRLYCGDQDAINYVFHRETGYLSPRYNYFTNYRYFRYRTLVRLCPAYVRVVADAAQYKRIRQSPRIIHYMGAERPWLSGNRNPYRRLFREALERTAFGPFCPERGQERQMAAYHVMNLLTLWFPPVRQILSRSFEKRRVLPRLAPLSETSGGKPENGNRQREEIPAGPKRQGENR